jgi:hypothetical protein
MNAAKRKGIVFTSVVSGRPTTASRLCWSTPRSLLLGSARVLGAGLNGGDSIVRVTIITYFVAKE